MTFCFDHLSPFVLAEMSEAVEIQVTVVKGQRVVSSYRFVLLYFLRYDEIPYSPFLMLIQSKINTERKVPNISKNYCF